MACATVLFDGLSAQGSLDKSVQALQSLPLGPASVTSYFESFGTVVYLFCVNFLIFPIQQNMARGKEWPVSVQQAVTATAACNAVFAALGYSFFGDETQEIILNNLGPGELLSAVKLLLCVDLLCSYPLVLVSGRDIVEKLILGDGAQAFTQNRDNATEGEDNQDEVCATEAGGRQGSLGNLFVGPGQGLWNHHERGRWLCSRYSGLHPAWRLGSLPQERNAHSSRDRCHQSLDCLWLFLS